MAVQTDSIEDYTVILSSDEITLNIMGHYMICVMSVRDVLVI